MTKREAARILLDIIDEKGPVNINWNHEKQWMDVLTLGLSRIEKRNAERQKGSQTVAAARDQR